MEQIDYKNLSNHKIFLFRYLIFAFFDVMFFAYFLEMDSILGKLICAAAILLSLYSASKIHAEVKEKQKRVVFYNNCVEKYESVLVDENTSNLYDEISRNVLKDRIHLIWQPLFEYEDETKVYNLLNTNLYTVAGYFKDIYYGRECKIKYTIIFINDKYYLNCVDNIIFCDKDAYVARFFKKNAIERSLKMR